MHLDGDGSSLVYETKAGSGVGNRIFEKKIRHKRIEKGEGWISLDVFTEKNGVCRGQLKPAFTKTRKKI